MILYVRSQGDPQPDPYSRPARNACGRAANSDGRPADRAPDHRRRFILRANGRRIAQRLRLLALGLASIGLYGILAYSVNQRKREIGLRMAIGAAQGSVLRLILKQGMSLVVTGMLIGFAAALLVGRI